MRRLCERPGCSDTGTVAYGMVPEELVFWLDGGVDEDDRALCQRHADAMIVPRGWTLDDRREPTPRLFAAGRFRSEPDHGPAASARRRRRRAPAGEQLVIDGTGEIDRPAPPADAGPTDDACGEPTPTQDRTGSDRPGGWVASFDASDDLDGVLAAESPLLARAFRGDRRR